MCSQSMGRFLLVHPVYFSEYQYQLCSFERRCNSTDRDMHHRYSTNPKTLYISCRFTTKISVFDSSRRHQKIKNYRSNINLENLDFVGLYCINSICSAKVWADSYWYTLYISRNISTNFAALNGVAIRQTAICTIGTPQTPKLHILFTSLRPKFRIVPTFSRLILSGG